MGVETEPNKRDKNNGISEKIGLICMKMEETFPFFRDRDWYTKEFSNIVASDMLHYSYLAADVHQVDGSIADLHVLFERIDDHMYEVCSLWFDTQGELIQSWSLIEEENHLFDIQRFYDEISDEIHYEVESHSYSD